MDVLRMAGIIDTLFAVITAFCLQMALLIMTQYIEQFKTTPQVVIFIHECILLMLSGVVGAL